MRDAKGNSFVRISHFASRITQENRTVPPDSPSLITVFDGWDGYQLSLVRAVAPRTPEELAWRSAPGLRSVGEVAAHISLGRIDWFQRIEAPGSAELVARVA